MTMTPHPTRSVPIQLYRVTTQSAVPPAIRLRRQKITFSPRMGKGERGEPPSDRGLNARCEGEAEKLLPRFTWVVAGSPAAPTVDLQPVTQVAAPSVLPNRYPKAEGAFCVRGITAAPLSLRYGRIPVGLYGHPASCLLRLRPLCTPSQAQPPLPALAEGAFSGFRGSSAYKLPCAVPAARTKASVSFRSA